MGRAKSRECGEHGWDGPSQRMVRHKTNNYWRVGCKPIKYHQRLHAHSVRVLYVGVANIFLVSQDARDVSFSLAVCHPMDVQVLNSSVQRVVRPSVRSSL